MDDKNYATIRRIKSFIKQIKIIYLKPSRHVFGSCVVLCFFPHEVDVVNDRSDNSVDDSGDDDYDKVSNKVSDNDYDDDEGDGDDDDDNDDGDNGDYDDDGDDDDDDDLAGTVSGLLLCLSFHIGLSLDL